MFKHWETLVLDSRVKRSLIVIWHTCAFLIKSCYLMTRGSRPPCFAVHFVWFGCLCVHRKLLFCILLGITAWLNVFSCSLSFWIACLNAPSWFLSRWVVWLGCIECMTCRLLQSMFAASVCLSYSFIWLCCAMCKYGWMDQCPAWYGDSLGPKEHWVRWRVSISPTDSMQPLPNYFGSAVMISLSVVMLPLAVCMPAYRCFCLYHCMCSTGAENVCLIPSSIFGSFCVIFTVCVCRDGKLKLKVSDYDCTNLSLSCGQFSC